MLDLVLSNSHVLYFVEKTYFFLRIYWIIIILQFILGIFD